MSGMRDVPPDGGPDLLRDSIESLSEGLAIYGPDCRLVVCNRRYVEMLHPVADVIRPGVYWPDLLRACAERGVYANPPHDVEAWLEEVVREPLMQRRDLEIMQADGRIYSVSHRPTSFGGFVITRTDITERRRAEATIRDREALLATVLDTIPVAIVMARSDDGRIIYRSREAQKDFPENVEYAQNHFADPRQRFEYVEALRRRGRLSDYRVDLRRGDGSVYHASLSGRVVAYGDQTYVVSAIGDLSERLDKEELLRHVVDACPTPLMMTRLDSGEVLFSSPESRALFGDPETSKTMYVEAEARKRYVGELRAKGSVREYKVELRKQDGERFWSASSARLIRYRGGDVIVSHMRDLTEQLAIEAELAAQREAMFQSEKLSAMGEILAGVAHELNNPLSVIVGHAQMLLDLDDHPDVRRHTEQISAAAGRCARIVRTFLAMARQQPARSETTSLNEVARTAAGVARYGEGAGSTRIELELADGLPTVVADPDQITQVVLNLLLNAEQAIRGTGRGDRILLRTGLSADGGHVFLEVEDNGPGIPEEVRGRIFEPFFTTKDVGEGTGIGLALSHRILQTHRGEIQLDPGFRGGTRFRLTLPVGQVQRGAADLAADAGPAQARARILIVDDEPDVAAVSGEILARQGYQVDVTVSALEAIARLRERSYDLVVSDLNMPGIDGRGLFEAISADFPELRERTAFLTGDTMGMSSQAFLREAGRPYLEKPVSPRELCDFVGALLAEVEPRA
jgi:PAS domain S-box-containing protein